MLLRSLHVQKCKIPFGRAGNISASQKNHQENKIQKILSTPEQELEKKTSFVYHQHFQFSLLETPNVTGVILRSGWELYISQGIDWKFSPVFSWAKRNFPAISQGKNHDTATEIKWWRDFLFDAFPEGLINLSSPLSF